jgi:prepilin-type N-terminal cleavage/methylation domain-containing protein
MSKRTGEDGFSLIEVMVAMVISGVALMGTMGAVELSSRHIQQGIISSRALGMAQARLEAKRSVRWQVLLEDDLDQDGIPETLMKDDGQSPDSIAGDGIYTATNERDGVTLVWTVEADHSGPLNSIGVVTIRAIATYQGPIGQREIRMATLRANPAFVGQQ